jgi:hypothetical protein
MLWHIRTTVAENTAPFERDYSGHIILLHLQKNQTPKTAHAFTGAIRHCLNNILVSVRKPLFVHTFPLHFNKLSDQAVSKTLFLSKPEGFPTKYERMTNYLKTGRFRTSAIYAKADPATIGPRHNTP